jgi:cell division transport system permease protein
MVGSITLVANSVVNKVRGNEEINVYLTDGMSDGDMLALDETIRSMHEVESTRLMSKEDAAREFERMFGGEFLSTLEENPLPRSIIIRMGDSYRMSTDLEQVAARLREVQGIESVEYSRDWMTKLDIIFLVFIIAEAVLIAVVVTACIMIISNTISLTLIARKEAIEIMRLVGATDSFIRKPFYMEGLLQGFLSGILAFGLFTGLYYWLLSSFPELSVYAYLFGIYGLRNLPVPALLSVIIPVGGFLGLLGSYVAVRRSL